MILQSTMDLKKKQQQRLEALDNAYVQLINVLNKKLDLQEVDPEKMKVSLSAYRQAADDSEAIFQQIVELTDALTEKKDTKEKTEFFGVEGRIK